MGCSHFIHILPAYQVKSLSQSALIFSLKLLLPFSPLCLHPTFQMNCFFFFFFFNKGVLSLPTWLTQRVWVISPTITRILTTQGQESARVQRRNSDSYSDSLVFPSVIYTEASEIKHALSFHLEECSNWLGHVETCAHQPGDNGKRFVDMLL